MALLVPPRRACARAVAPWAPRALPVRSREVRRLSPLAFAIAAAMALPAAASRLHATRERVSSSPPVPRTRSTPSRGAWATHVMRRSRRAMGRAVLRRATRASSGGRAGSKTKRSRRRRDRRMALATFRSCTGGSWRDEATCSARPGGRSRRSRSPAPRRAATVASRCSAAPTSLTMRAESDRSVTPAPDTLNVRAVRMRATGKSSSRSDLDSRMRVMPSPLVKPSVIPTAPKLDGPDAGTASGLSGTKMSCRRWPRVGPTASAVERYIS
mmetsp:Transcript_24481/g.72068  ORF Transcript_24481/g.72068 Transcript_24481/m.72068 type:complete len:270 (-) Transcript_24481:163-972(-)